MCRKHPVLSNCSRRCMLPCHNHASLSWHVDACCVLHRLVMQGLEEHADLHIQEHTQAHAHTHKHTLMQTGTHKYAHLHTRAHTHTHAVLTRTWARSLRDHEAEQHHVCARRKLRGRCLPHHPRAPHGACGVGRALAGDGGAHHGPAGQGGGGNAPPLQRSQHPRLVQRGAAGAQRACGPFVVGGPAHPAMVGYGVGYAACVH